ncbi:MBL fold hydrolase [Taibaiella sp. KBW10]|uniref:MBL fold metallo-hydrolase n=1 Tax=Taibaiella sp. KBW10 TaxID=2153357 RepID=UPI000F5B0B34|nr:MBL fold metallo-hydrolase [Taibaiella sp. KBW10]RQO30418.1 MBL fold hydrolase [Taibaiella sp. KBW10]
MLQIQQFTCNPFQENSYVIYNEKKQCWIIDPGMYGVDEEQKMYDFIANEMLVPQQIINTHTHIDHIFAVDSVKQRYNIPFGMHRLEEPVLRNAVSSAVMFGFNFNVAPIPDFFIEEGSLSLGVDSLEVRLAPGHSPGSIVFYSQADNFVIAGDVLFQRSIGRTDLPGGDYDTLINSIRQQLFTLPEETVVLSGHGAATTIGEEKVLNPFLQ